MSAFWWIIIGEIALALILLPLIAWLHIQTADNIARIIAIRARRYYDEREADARRRS